MSEPKITGFIVGFLLVSMFAGLFALSMADFGTNYNVDTSGVNLSEYNQLSTLNTQANAAKGNITKISQPEGVLDVIGGLLVSGYNVLITIPTSFDLFQQVASQALSDSGLGTGGALIMNTLITIVLVLIFIGIVLTALIKWRL